jgi:hypothetical protein
VNIFATFQVRYNIAEVVVLQFIPRPRPRYLSGDTYGELVHKANSMLKEELTKFPRVLYWKIRGIKKPTTNIFRDCVHWNFAGMIRYYKNIRGAVLKLLKS